MCKPLRGSANIPITPSCFPSSRFLSPFIIPLCVARSSSLTTSFFHLAFPPLPNTTTLFHSPFISPSPSLSMWQFPPTPFCGRHATAVPSPSRSLSRRCLTLSTSRWRWLLLLTPLQRFQVMNKRGDRGREMRERQRWERRSERGEGEGEVGRFGCLARQLDCVSPCLLSLLPNGSGQHRHARMRTHVHRCMSRT